jgi:hypothetical protein
MKAAWTLMALSLSAAGSLAGCSVGAYHIPDVPPVVMPEPEEDMFADLEMGGESSSGGGEEQPAPPAEEPQPTEAAAPAEGPAEEPAKAPAKKKK